MYDYTKINKNETREIVGEIKEISSEYKKDRNLNKYQINLNYIKTYLESLPSLNSKNQKRDPNRLVKPLINRLVKPLISLPLNLVANQTEKSCK